MKKFIKTFLVFLGLKMEEIWNGVLKYISIMVGGILCLFLVNILFAILIENTNNHWYLGVLGEKLDLKTGFIEFKEYIISKESILSKSITGTMFMVLVDFCLVVSLTAPLILLGGIWAVGYIIYVITNCLIEWLKDNWCEAKQIVDNDSKQNRRNNK